MFYFAFNLPLSWSCLAVVSLLCCSCLVFCYLLFSPCLSLVSHFFFVLLSSYPNLSLVLILSLALPCLGANLLVDNILGGTYDAHKPIAIDGFDVWNTISRGDASPRTEILLNIDNQPPNGTQGLGENYQGMALRMGSMKLMMNVKNITWFKPPELGGIPLEESYSNGLITEKTDEEVLFQIKEHYMVSAISNIVSFFSILK